MAIYVGAGGVKTPTAIYVGAGGVKTVSAVYVGVGSVKQVWPTWSNGDDLFDPTTESWYWYRNDHSYSWTDSQTNRVQGTSSYVSFPWTFPSSSTSVSAQEYGIYIASTTSMSYSGIKYLVVECRPYTTLNASGTSWWIYMSIGSSRTTLPQNDSGNGSVRITGYDSYGSRSDSSKRYIIVNMTNCSRTGYFKLEAVWNLGSTWTSSDNARFELYSIKVYDSYPSLSYSLMYDCTVT